MARRCTSAMASSKLVSCHGLYLSGSPSGPGTPRWPWSTDSLGCMAMAACTVWGCSRAMSMAVMRFGSSHPQSMTPSTPTCCAWFSSSSTLYTGTSGWPFSWASWLMARENGTTDATCVWLSMTCAFSGSGCGAGAQLRSRWCLLMPPAYARWQSCFGSRVIHRWQWD